MATGATYTGSQEFLIRLQTLIIDGGTDVLRNIFDQKLRNVPLGTVLAKEINTIKNLQKQKVITQTQYAKLFPQTGPLPTSADFDITLLVCLLRNLPSLGLNLKYTWNTPPKKVDMSVEADICRLKIIRNKIAHISSTEGLKRTHFIATWKDTEQVLLRLNTAVRLPVKDLQQKIENYRRAPIDPQNIQAISEQWQKMNDLKEEMVLIKTDVKEVQVVGQDTNAIAKENRKSMKNVEQSLNKVAALLIVAIAAGICGFIFYGADLQLKMLTILILAVTTISQLFQYMKNDASKNADEAYRHLKTNLRNELIEFYRGQHATFHLSILDDDENIPLLEFYVMPDINEITLERAFGGGVETKTQIPNFCSVFFKDGTLCSEIYLTADAGLGKTSFSK